ncbi:MAG: GntR family transcriptional regulator [Dermatophilaceae bacterium]
MPRYREIAERFRSRILQGDLRPGDELPSERTLALEYGIARPTATRALELLRHEGLVESVQGSGTFVVDLHRRAADRYRRSRELGRVYGAGERAVVLVAELAASPPRYVSQALGVEGPAVRRRRVILRDDEPEEVSTSWFDGALAGAAPNLLVTERIRQGTVAYVSSVTGRAASYAVDRMAAREAGAQDAADLALPQGGQSPVLVVEHTVFDAADRPMEFAEAIYPPGRWTHEERYRLS